MSQLPGRPQQVLDREHWTERPSLPHPPRHATRQHVNESKGHPSALVRRQSLPFLLLGLVLLSTTNACSTGDAARVGTGGDCQSDRDCLYGLICRAPQGQSVKRCILETYGPCQDDDDCYSGRRCESGQCVTECIVDSDCPESRPVCRVGACEGSERLRCVTSADCGVGEECVSGRCLMRMGGGCLSDFDCPASMRCIAGMCR